MDWMMVFPARPMRSEAHGYAMRAHVRSKSEIPPVIRLALPELLSDLLVR
jgi:hypothetical protein